MAGLFRVTLMVSGWSPKPLSLRFESSTRGGLLMAWHCWVIDVFFHSQCFRLWVVHWALRFFHGSWAAGSLEQRIAMMLVNSIWCVVLLRHKGPSQLPLVWFLCCSKWLTIRGAVGFMLTRPVRHMGFAGSSSKARFPLMLRVCAVVARQSYI